MSATDPNRRVMAQRLVVCRIGPTGEASLPRRVSGVTVWDVVHDWGDGATKEYRLEGTERVILVRVLAMVPLPDGAQACVAFISSPAAAPDRSSAAFDSLITALTTQGVVRGQWAASLQPDGSYAFSSLATDQTAVARLARAVLADRVRRLENGSTPQETPP